MKRFAALALFSVIAVVPGFSADPQLLNMALPDAEMYAGINLQQAKTSQFAQYLLGKLPSDGGLQEFIDKTGFDPRRDITEVLVTTKGMGMPQAAAPDAHGNALFLAKGNFNVAQILAAAGQDNNIKVASYAGANVLTVGDGKMKHAIGLIDDSTVIAGDRDSVMAALDRRSVNNAIEPALATRIHELSTTSDAWSVSNADFSAFMPVGAKDQSGSAVLKGVKQVSGTIKFGAEMKIDAQAITKDASDATALSDVIRFFTQMLQMGNQAENGPVVQIRALLKNLLITTEGNVVKVSLSVPEGQLETLIDSAKPHSGRI